MKKHRSLQQYRAIDLAMFVLMLLVFEGIIITASIHWFPGQPYIVSLVPAMVGIVLVRWGPWAAIHAVLGGALGCRMLGAVPSQYALYCIGNCFPLLLLPWVNRWRGTGGKPRSTMQAMGYGLCVLFAMQAGRAIMSLLLGASPATALGCFTTETVTDLFTLVLLWIVSRLDGVLEDQKHYLERIRKEEKALRF